MVGCGGKNSEKRETGSKPDLAIPFNFFPIIPWAGISLPPPISSPLFSTVTLPPEFDLCDPHQAALSGTSFQWDQLEDSQRQSWKLGQSEVCGC